MNYNKKNYNCVYCKKLYHRSEEHKNAKDLKGYVKWIGLCTKKCLHKLDNQEKSDLFLSAYLNELIEK